MIGHPCRLQPDIVNAAARIGIDPYSKSFKPSDLDLDPLDYNGSYSEQPWSLFDGKTGKSGMPA